MYMNPMEQDLSWSLNIQVNIPLQVVATRHMVSPEWDLLMYFKIYLYILNLEHSSVVIIFDIQVQWSTKKMSIQNHLSQSHQGRKQFLFFLH